MSSFTIPIQPASVTSSKIAAYLKREIKRYFPKAIVSVVFDDPNERILIKVALGNSVLQFVHESGSDDDWYTFTLASSK